MERSAALTQSLGPIYLSVYFRFRFLYRQDPISFSFATESSQATEPRSSQLPEELQRGKEPYGFVGRDSAVLALERALRRAPAGILIQGLGGVGKTTLARGFLQWLDSTNGLGNGAFWLSFQEIRSAEYVFNRLGEPIFGGQFSAAPTEQKIKALAKAFKENRFVIVWDNFESAAGISGTAVTANLQEDDRQLLATFLDELRGGATKIIITSRSSEDWLGPQRRFLLPLGGLDREERWEYCEIILHDLGLTIDRNDKDLVALMDLLGGHALSMRIILPRLEKRSAAQVAAALRSNLASFDTAGDEAQARLFSTLQFVQQSLPDHLRPLLIPLGMHEGYVDADFLEAMASQIDKHWTRNQIDALIQALVSAGLLRDQGQAVYELHPLLTSFLRSTTMQDRENCDLWARAFVDVIARFADRLARLERHEQRLSFRIFAQSFHYALAEAERLEMPRHVLAITQSLANFALNTRNFADASRLFERLAQHAATSKDAKLEAAAYNQLGLVAHEQSDVAGAEQWYRRSLEINERLGNEHDATKTYHQLGIVAQEQRDFAGAEQWYRKALEIKERLGNEHEATKTYHQLGRVAQEQRDFAGAERWYRKSLEIKERLGNEYGAALTYHQLGIVAEHQSDFAAAEQWYRKSLEIKERLGDEQGAAPTYHQMGRVAAEQRDFGAAEQWYRKSLEIEEKLGNEQGAAISYHQLGQFAAEQRDFDAAAQWYLRSLAISEKLGNELEAAGTYAQLGVVAGLMGDFCESGQRFIQSVAGFLQTNEARSASAMMRAFMFSFENASAQDQVKLKALWTEAGLGDFPTQETD